MLNKRALCPQSTFMCFVRLSKQAALLLFVIYIEGQFNVNIIVQPFDKDQTRDAKFTALRIHIRNKRKST